MATTATRQKTTATLVCAECGKTFTRPAALGAHRSRVHGVAGSSKNATARRRGSSATAAPRETRRQATKRASASNGAGRTVDHDALLRVLFPSGIPPKQEVMAAVNEWLAEA